MNSRLTLFFAALSLVGCGAPSMTLDAGAMDSGVVVRCSASNCDGCCSDSGECFRGTNVDACGSAGASCSICSAAQVCQKLSATSDFGGACSHLPRAFGTSSKYSGGLGGRAGADAKCATHATAANLAGTFKAFLATATEGPATRFSGGPWYQQNGTGFVKVFNNAANLLTTPLTTDLFDENGVKLPDGELFWLGETSTCFDWVGATSASTGGVCNLSNWSSCSTTESCGQSHRLFCLEI